MLMTVAGRISIAICTYNGEHRVPDVLDALWAQEEAADVSWEVLVVDNNSTDEIKALVQRYANTRPDSVDLRYLFEEKQGKSNAIKKAFEEATGEWVAFLDDDNIPEPDWVKQAAVFGATHERAGAFGGRVVGMFDTAPPRSFGIVGPLFALNSRPNDYCYNGGGKLEFGAAGAGLVVRRDAWKAALPDSGLQMKGPDAKGRGTVSEDLEMQWWLHKAGWEIWHNASMTLHHKIPVSRFDTAYLRRFFTAIGDSRHYIRMLPHPWWRRPFVAIGYFFSDLRSVLAILLKYRRRTFSDPFVRGRLRMLYCMLKRPWQFWR